MTDIRTAAQAVLDVWFRPHGINYVDFMPYMEALRQALAEHDNRKPIAWEVETKSYGKGYSFSNEFLEAFPRFPLPPEPVEPVAYPIFDGEGDYDYRTELPNAESIAWSARYDRYWKPLYTTPPSVDALIAEIEVCKAVDNYGWSYYSANDVKQILDKYRGVK